MHVLCMCYARGALISQELLSRVRHASQELFSQNVDLGALGAGVIQAKELSLLDLDKTHLFASSDVPGHVIGFDLGCVRPLL